MTSPLHMNDVKKDKRLKMKMNECIGGFVNIAKDLKLAMAHDEL